MCCFAVQALQQTEVLFLGSVLSSTQDLVQFIHKHFWLHSCLNLYVYVFIPMSTPIHSTSGGRSPADDFSGGFISMRSFRAHFHSALTHRSLSLSLFFYYCLIQETLTKSALPRPECSRDSLMQTELVILLRNSKKLLFVGSCFTQC